MFVAILLVGMAVSDVDVTKGDAIVKAEIDLVKLSYFCGSQSYKMKVDAAKRSITRLDSATSFKRKDISEVDRGLKAGTIKPEVKIDKSDCGNLIDDAAERVEELYKALSD